MVLNKVSPVLLKLKSPVELFLVALIVLKLAPTEVFGHQFKSQFDNVVRMTRVHQFMNNSLVKLFFWTMLVFVCCYKKDMRLFTLIVLYYALR